MLGILCLCLSPLAILPIIFGIIGITQTGRTGPRKGMGLAIAGLALGCVGVLGSCLWIGILLPALGAARHQATILVSTSQMRSIVQGAIIYANDHDEEFPPADAYPDVFLDLGLLDPEILVSPAEDGDGISYIYLGGSYTFDPQQIIVYEDPKHFHEGVIVGFADAHVEMIDHDVFEKLLAEQTGQSTLQKSATRVRAMVQSVIIYAADHGERFPPIDQWPDAVVDLGLLDTETLESSDPDNDGVTYIYLGGWNSFSANEIVVYEDPDHWPDNGVVVGFADSHVAIIPFDEFEQMLAAQQADTQP